ncbi:apolipoprotein N-acyltransferase [Chrysiogenes arsenatis]|uniref:apolipoprotein N-acyltransferase n=1 Tax=Chrysiogenes arsenatis TaxID=309797 RepID=UPI0003FBDA2A|nr:apolipoprotein N-acyltransferase [Chrysiogenes arsenatis]
MPYIVTILCALAMSNAFAPEGFPFLGWFVLAPWLVILARSAHPFRLALLFGFFYHGSLLYWVGGIFSEHALESQWFGIPAVALLSFYLALYIAIWGWRAAKVLQKPTVWSGLELAAWGVVAEVSRGVLFTGFPWLSFGYSLSTYEIAVPLLQHGGIWLLDFLVLFVNITLALCWLRPHFSVLVRHAFFVALLLGFSLWQLHMVTPPAEPERSIPVRIVQGNIDQHVKWDAEYATHNLNRYLTLSRQGGWRGGLLVWPESSLPFFWSSHDPLKDDVLRLVQESGSDLVTGVLSAYTDMTTRYYNSVMLLEHTGSTPQFYHKQHLVPFGEYTPLKESLLPFVEKFVVGEDYSAGHSSAPLLSRFGKIGTFICYESIFPAAVALIAAEADFLVNVTNDAWLGDTLGPLQHWLMARARAIENGKYLIRSTNTGITSVFTPRGEEIALIGWNQAGYVDTFIAPISTPTWFTSYPWVVPAAGGLIAMLAMVLGISNNRKPRSYH